MPAGNYQAMAVPNPKKKLGACANHCFFGKPATLSWDSGFPIRKLLPAYVKKTDMDI
jgi:hypothetical protein